MKTPVITSEDYIVYLELFSNNLFIHCDCFRWSKKVKTTLTKDFNTFLSVLRQPVLAIHEIEDSKHLKFLNLMGFNYLQDFTGSDNKKRQLFIRNYHGN